MARFQENAIAAVRDFQFKKISGRFFSFVAVAVLKGIRTATFCRKVYPTCAVLQGSDSTLQGAVSEAEYL